MDTVNSHTAYCAIQRAPFTNMHRASQQLTVALQAQKAGRKEAGRGWRRMDWGINSLKMHLPPGS